MLIRVPIFFAFQISGSMLPTNSYNFRMKLLFLIAFISTGETPRTMRLDFYHTGNAAQELYSVDKVVVEPLPWSGNPNRPVDDSNLGNYLFEVRNPSTKKPIYSRGFGSVFGEWVTTAEAKSANRTFHESLRFPTPDSKVEVIVKKRAADNGWKTSWTTTVDPKDPFVDPSQPPTPGALIEIEKHGDPAQKVDLLLLGDGYTAVERGKFEADARRMIACLFATSPFKERRNDFNVWGLCPAAHESGVSRPSSGIHRTSPIGATYDVFGSERYLLTFDNRSFRQIASFAPYDFVEILTNSQTYGGGGIFGLYGTVAAHSTWAPYVFVHEFGHHFAGLADEYYTSPVAYLPTGRKVEPWEPNATGLLDPGKLKWKNFVQTDTPLPTPWKKSEYEIWSREYQKLRANIRSEGRPESEMDKLFLQNRRREESLLKTEKYAGKVGAFEGANYEAKGYYRPEANCIMFTRTDFFCTVCRRAIESVIDRYTTQ